MEERETRPLLDDENHLPLHGVRVLDLTRMLPGPFCTQILADFGADVIKIEDVEFGDPFRSTEPKMGGVAVRHLTLNRNKRSLAVDLSIPLRQEVAADGGARNVEFTRAIKDTSFDQSPL